MRGPAGEKADGAVDLERRITAHTAGFERDRGYRAPVRSERRAVAEGVGLLLDGHRERARKRLTETGYAVRVLVDRPTGRRYAEVADVRPGAVRGWGRVYLDLSAPARWSVQVPHPVADADSERLGVEVLRGTPGGVLILAGAHRRAGRGDEADVAHRRDTVFHAVCDALLDRGLPAVQLHGMADDSAPGHDVVASTGAGARALPEARALAAALRDRGFGVCRAWFHDCPLEGRTNAQGRRAEEAGLPFLHVEFDRRTRADRSRTSQAAEALTTVTRTWAP